MTTAPTEANEPVEPKRVLRLPAPHLGNLEPLTRVDAGYLRSGDFLVRMSVLSAIAFGGLALLFVRLWSLQVLHGPQYAHSATQQTLRVVIGPGPRGTVVDAHGRPLAGTDGLPVVTVDPKRLGTKRADASWRPTAQGRVVLERLAQASGVPFAKLVRRIRDGLEAAPYLAPVVLPQLSVATSFAIIERQSEFPGVHVGALAVRAYPQGALGSEFLGLVGQIGPEQLKQKRYDGYRAGELIGQSGIEWTYDRLLRGGLSGTRVVVNALGAPVGSPKPLDPHHAPRGLQLTIDARLQRATERALRDGIAFAHATGHGDAASGAAVVMDPRTGAVKALASFPTYNQVAAARNPGYLSALLDPRNAARPLLNRAIQGVYPAGSSFKPIVAEAALASGLLTPSSTLACTGSLRVGDTIFHNVDGGINATLSLPQALAISCDTWFYRVGVGFYEHSSGALRYWARQLGIAHPTGIDLPGEAPGLLSAPQYEGDLVNNAIGQGRLQVTPLQLAVAYSALANGGTVVRPHLARAILSPSGRVSRVLSFPPLRHLRLKGLAAIHEGLYLAAHAPGGTSARLFADFPVPVAGKTGTAQTPDGSDDSWYASWAPARHPKVVVVVVIEHGGFGAQAAAPAAREIYSAYFGVRAKAGR